MMDYAQDDMRNAIAAALMAISKPPPQLQVPQMPMQGGGMPPQPPGMQPPGAQQPPPAPGGMQPQMQQPQGMPMAPTGIQQGVPPQPPQGMPQGM